MKKITISFIICMICLCIHAQDGRKAVAVVPAEGPSVSLDIKIGVTNGLQEGVFNSGEYILLARGKAFEKALNELKFQASDFVSDNNLKEFGNATGADFVCYATLSKYSEKEYRISYKMIDVSTGEIVNMGSETVREGVSGLLTATDNIAKKLFGTGDTSSGMPANTVMRNGKTFNLDGIEMVFVEGKGQGITGIKGFYIGKYEITQAQWRAVMNSSPSYFKGDDFPVETVNLNEIKEFISRLNKATGRNYRLPTEAEWEFAALGGTANSFCSGGCVYSGSNTIADVAWYYTNSGQRTHKVGTKNPNELGIYDMSGNVWEWCLDCFDTSCSRYVLRGGSWFSDGQLCRVSNRANDLAGTRSSTYGFRLVLIP